MNSLEDAYVKIAKAEEKLYSDKDALINYTQDITEENGEFQRYLQSVSNPSFCTQSIGMFIRRMQ
jgi:hypothetical protein